jgi:hypothetical protein
MSPLAIGIMLIILWALTLTILLTPTRVYKSAFDRVTRAHYRDDRVALQIMLDHLRSFPEQWSISRDGASFPLEGAKQIYLSLDKKEGLEYTLASFGGSARPLNGYFGAEFQKELSYQNNQRESQAVLKKLYPELHDGRLLLK